MTDAELDRALRSVGMAAFVQHMALWEGGLDAASAAGVLSDTTGWRAIACRTRVNYARAILKAGLCRAALERVAAAERADDAARELARRLLRG